MEDYAQMITSEMGKPITESRAEVNKCAWVCDYYAENAAEFLAPQEVKTDAKQSFVRHDPIGAVFEIMPWTFPFWQVFRFAAPTLTAGTSGSGSYTHRTMPTICNVLLVVVTLSSKIQSN